MKRWLQNHVTGTPEANALLEAAERALEDYRGPADDEFHRLNVAVHEAEQGVPWLRRLWIWRTR